MVSQTMAALLILIFIQTSPEARSNPNRYILDWQCGRTLFPGKVNLNKLFKPNMCSYELPIAWYYVSYKVEINIHDFFFYFTYSFKAGLK